MGHNLGDQELTSLNGAELVADLVNGAVIKDVSHDGRDWHLLVEYPIKLKDCRGRADDTWKYAIYETSAEFGRVNEFSKMSEHNRTPREMVKEFDDRFWESRMWVRQAEKAEESNAQAA